jgi:hypothetical protein
MSDTIRFDTSPFAGIGRGRDGRLDSSDPLAQPVDVRRTDGDTIDGKTMVSRRHIDFLQHQIRWRWLLDSYEGGDRYRNATYGPDRMGLPLRNLFRHRREYPDPQQFPTVYGGFAGGLAATSGDAPAVGYGPYPGMLGADPGALAKDDDYEMRRARTPVPEFVAEAVEIHLSKVYDQEVTRDGPADLVEWWKDVDGAGTPIDDWMSETVAPLLLVVGTLCVCLDHPRLPPGVRPEDIRSRDDEIAYGLDRVVASYILPENMVWWDTDPAGRITVCLVREYEKASKRQDFDPGTGREIDSEEKSDRGEQWRANYERFRYWDNRESILFSFDGEILERLPHSFGRVPIVRLTDLKKHRTPGIGKSRYEAIAELQREYYNRDSELILSDTLQAHPLLSGPEDYCKADNTLSIGPGYVLPKKKNSESGTYEGWEYTSPDKDPAASLRTNKQDLIDMKDRRACLTKPVGAAHGHGAGQGTGTVAQSGISKKIDSATGHKFLASIAKSLAKAERFLAEYALLVLRNRIPTPADRETIRVVYPAKFELESAAELIDGLTNMQRSFALAGQAPKTESLGYKSIVRQLLQGLPDEEYAALDHEIDELLTKKAREAGGEGQPALPPPGITDRAEAMAGRGSEESLAGTDPVGQSASTLIGNTTPSVP